ncbi:MAG: TIM barrel protein, partial [Planctomycetes bacterium]|nr:TIM barrel protein [Planctomycetota bacterium]
MTRILRRGCLAVFCVGVLGYLAADQRAAAAERSVWPFFAFDNAVGRDQGLKPEEQAEILSQLGYQGIGHTGVKNIPELCQAMEARGLKMFSTYIQVNLGGSEVPYDPGLPQAIEQLKGRGTALWIHLHGASSPSDALDDRAVDVVREIAAMAESSGLPVVLYPHVGFYVATNQDALRVVKKVDRKNVGTSFNLCHFLKQQDEAELKGVIEESMPHLMLVSINGADSGATREMG